MAEPVSPLIDGGPEPAERAEVARQVNEAIYEMAAQLDSVDRNDSRVGFLCECGCLALVTITAAEYRAAGGAHIAGHARPSRGRTAPQA